MKEWKEIFCTNANQREADVIIHLSNKIDFASTIKKFNCKRQMF
jgi:hypothetical protein